MTEWLLFLIDIKNMKLTFFSTSFSKFSIEKELFYSYIIKEWLQDRILKLVTQYQKNPKLVVP